MIILSKSKLLHFNIKFSTLCLVCFVVLVSCCRQVQIEYLPEKEGLRKLTFSEMVERSHKKIYPKRENITYRNSKGVVLNRDSIFTNSSKNDLIFDNYVDSSGTVVLMIVRTATSEDKDIMKKFEKAISQGRKLDPIVVDCLTLDTTLAKVLEDDQKNRENIDQYNADIDHRNLSKVVSILNTCDVNKFSEQQIHIVWLVIQHAPLNYKKEYLSLFEQYAQDGKLDNRDVLMMKDRVLVDEGKPQIYGTQICKNKQTQKQELCKTIDMKNLNDRRFKVGFEPIEVYLMNWNIKLPNEENN